MNCCPKIAHSHDRVITFALLIDLALTCCLWICELGLCDSKICAQATAQERQRGNVADLPSKAVAGGPHKPSSSLLPSGATGSNVFYSLTITVTSIYHRATRCSTYKYLQSAFITVSIPLCKPALFYSPAPAAAHLPTLELRPPLPQSATY